METRNRVYIALIPSHIHNDWELAAKTDLPLQDVRYHLKKLEAGGLIDFIKEVRVKRKVYHAYKTKQQRLFND